MTDLHNVESLVLEHLRHIRADLGDVKERMNRNAGQSLRAGGERPRNRQQPGASRRTD